MAFSGIPLIGTWAAVSGYIPTWADQMQESQIGKTMLPAEKRAEFTAAKTPKVRSQLLKASLSPDQWVTVRSKSSHAKAAVQLVMGIGAIIGCIAASVLGGIFGRRPVYFALCLLSLLSCAYLFRCFDVFDAYFIIVAAVVGGITAAFYGWLPLYLPELFPTRVRATGQGLSFNCGRVLAAAGTLCMGQFVALFGNDYGQAMAAVTLIYLLGLVLIWFAPETKGQPLPD